MPYQKTAKSGCFWDRNNNYTISIRFTLITIRAMETLQMEHCICASDIHRNTTQMSKLLKSTIHWVTHVLNQEQSHSTSFKHKARCEFVEWLRISSHCAWKKNGFWLSFELTWHLDIVYYPNLYECCEKFSLLDLGSINDNCYEFQIWGGKNNKQGTGPGSSHLIFFGCHGHFFPLDSVDTHILCLLGCPDSFC